LVSKHPEKAVAEEVDCVIENVGELVSTYSLFGEYVINTTCA